MQEAASEVEAAAPAPGPAVPVAADVTPAFSAWVAAHGDVTDTTQGHMIGGAGRAVPAQVDDAFVAAGDCQAAVTRLSE